MKIFITGCAKSGTTLVRRLFNAYDLKVATEEMDLLDFYLSDYDVAKRTHDSILSNIKYAIADAYFILCKDIKIINVTRNPKDTMRSGYVSGERWDACSKQREQFKKLITYQIHFEGLMGLPDLIQKDIAEILDLTIIHKWSDYPKFIDESKEDTTGSYSLRPIGADYE